MEKVTASKKNTKKGNMGKERCICKGKTKRSFARAKWKRDGDNYR